MAKVPDGRVARLGVTERGLPTKGHVLTALGDGTAVYQPSQGGGDGIRFNTDNEGGWLDIQTNDQDGGGRGIDIRDQSGGGFGLQALNGGGGDIQAEWLDLVASGGGDPIASYAILLRGGTQAGGMQIEHGTPTKTTWNLTAGTGIVQQLQTSESFVVKDNGGTPVFQVDEDGTITPSTAGIAFGSLQTGAHLNVKTTGRITYTPSPPEFYGISLHDTGGTSLGVYIASDSANVDIATGATGGITLVGALTSGDAVFIHATAGGDITAKSDSGDVKLTATAGDVDLSAGGDVNIGSTGGDIQMTADQVATLTSVNSSVSLDADTGFVALISDDTRVDVQGTGGGGPLVTVTLPAAGVFKILDHNLNPMLLMTEGDPNLYIKTGGILSPTL